MSSPSKPGGVVGRWINQHGEQEGAYAALAGFEADMRARSDKLIDAYDELDIYVQIDLFALVADLLEEEAREKPEGTP